MKKWEKMLSEARKGKQKVTSPGIETDESHNLPNMDSQALNHSESGPTDLDNKPSEPQSLEKVEENLYVIKIFI